MIKLKCEISNGLTNILIVFDFNIFTVIPYNPGDEFSFGALLAFMIALSLIKLNLSKKLLHYSIFID